VARQFGCRDWNVLAARHDEAPITPKPEVDEAGRVPEGWFAAGRKDLLWHDLTTLDGRPAILIEAQTQAINAGKFLTVMQRFDAADFIGHRISFRAALRVDEAIGHGRIWIRVDGHEGRRAIAFDNLGIELGPNSPVSGTTGWEMRCVTVDVPEDARYISMGVLFGSGAGRLHAADLSFGPATDGEQPRPLPTAPRNLALTPSMGRSFT